MPRLRRRPGTALAVCALIALPAAAFGQTITEFPVPTMGSQPFGIVAGADGALWFTESSGDKIGRITTTGTITEFPVPTAGAQPFSITAGPDGNIWFTEVSAQQIGRISPNGTVTEFPISGGGGPGGIALGADGALWFSLITGNEVGRITTAGAITEFPIPTGGAIPHQLGTGPDGTLWFPEVGTDKVGRIDTGGTISEFPLPSSGAEPFGITTGPDGNLWFSEFTTGKIGRITPSGSITEFPLADSASNPLLLASGADGAVWFTQAATSQVARITTAGVVTEFTVPTAGSLPQGIAAGPDGNLWFVEQTANRIGRLVPAASTSPLVAAVLPSSRSVVTGATATAFATMINSGSTAATECAITPVSAVPVDFTYQTTDPATNALAGTPDTPVTIEPGAAQSFLVAFATNADFVPIDVVLGFACGNAIAAPSGAGLNTLLLSASATPTPDIIALSATASNDGILDLPGADGAAAFALATDNLGAAATLAISADTGDAVLPVSLAICPTDAATGACSAAAAASITIPIAAGATPTFAIFVQASGTVPFEPAANRISVRFRDAGGAVRGSTSVALRTQ